MPAKIAPASQDIAGMTTGRRLKSIFSGSLGNLVEWYDWYAYAAFSLYFAPAFFPQGGLDFAIAEHGGNLCRGLPDAPARRRLAAGPHADRHGHKSALMLSVLMMCAGSLIIVLAPGHDRIGIAAPTLLVIARLLQGLGGKYDASAIYLSEMASRAHRGF